MKEEKAAKKGEFCRRTSAQAIKWKDIISTYPSNAGRTMLLSDFVELGQKVRDSKQFANLHPEDREKTEKIKGKIIEQMYPQMELQMVTWI